MTFGSSTRGRMLNAKGRACNVWASECVWLWLIPAAFFICCPLVKSIGQIGLLPQLFGKVFVPDAVYNELCHPTAPPLLSEWTRQPPAWLEVASINPIDDEMFRA